MVWLMANEMIDSDEKLESMCPECREEVTSKCKCIRCGKTIPKHDDSFVNPNFDNDKYESLRKEGGI